MSRVGERTSLGRMIPRHDGSDVPTAVVVVVQLG
jgi:hypothetical protein